MKLVEEAKQTQKGMNIFAELGVFILVFLVSSLVEGFIVAPVQLAMLFGNKEYIQATMAGDVTKVTEIAMSLMNNPYLSVLSLFATGGMILTVILFCRWIQKRKVTSLGFVKKNWVKQYLLGCVVGFVMFSVAVGICVLTGSVSFAGVSSTFQVGLWILFLLGFLVQGMAEEVLCRGYFLVSVGRRYSLVVGIIANSIFFSALHLLNAGLSVLALVNLVLFGVFASVYFIKTENIWGVGAIHSIWNFVQGNLYGIRVSGTPVHCSIFEIATNYDKTLINGGDFGLEGGLGVTIVLVVATVITLLIGKKKELNLEEKVL